MAIVDDLKEELVSLIDEKRASKRKGCACCDYDSDIVALQNRIAVIEFSGADYKSAEVTHLLIEKKRTPNSLTITLSDFESDGFTYLNSAYTGITDYLVYLNFSGNRFLTFEEDGFIILPQGGFRVDPNKIELQSGQPLIIIY